MSFFDKLRYIVFGEEEEEEFDENEVIKPIRREKSLEFIDPKQGFRKDHSKVISLQTTMQMEVVSAKPDQYDDAKEICDNLKDNKPVIVNLENLEAEIAQRLMDFISGTCYSLGGIMQRISDDIIIIAPANVDLSGEFKEELRNKGILTPMKDLYKL